MRLFYQSFGVSRGSRDGAYGQLLKRIVESAASPGTEIAINGLAPNRALADQYRYLEFIDTVEVLENGLRAEKEGYDAFLLGNIFEPGLHELRELLNIPVLGLRDRRFTSPASWGRISPSSTSTPSSRPASWRASGRRVSSPAWSQSKGCRSSAPSVFDLALRDPEAKSEIVRQFVEAARRSIDKGAEVLLPAGGSLMAVLADAGVHEVDSTPVLNGLMALIKTAEMAVQMRALTGTFTSKRLVYAPPTGKLLSDVREAYGDHVYPGAA